MTQSEEDPSQSEPDQVTLQDWANPLGNDILTLSVSSQMAGLLYFYDRIVLSEIIDLSPTDPPQVYYIT